MDPKDKVIVALDTDSGEKALKLVESLKKDVRFFKVGLELFSSCGPGIVERIKKAGCEIFLDLKFHDIPNTAAKAAAAVTKLAPFMFNVHALGGYDMMKRALEASEEAAKKLKIAIPRILAVTILTSMDEKALMKIGIGDKMGQSVLRLADAAKAAGLHGVVASPAEAGLVRERFGKDFLIVTPGVRPAGSASNDQKRTATPKGAMAAGASFLVIGRPITEAKDPAAAARAVLKEMKA